MEKSNKALLEARLAASEREQHASAVNSRVEHNARFPGSRDEPKGVTLDALTAEFEQRERDM